MFLGCCFERPWIYLGCKISSKFNITSLCSRSPLCTTFLEALWRKLLLGNSQALLFQLCSRFKNVSKRNNIQWGGLFTLSCVKQIYYNFGQEREKKPHDWKKKVITVQFTQGIFLFLWWLFFSGGKLALILCFDKVKHLLRAKEKKNQFQLFRSFVLIYHRTAGGPFAADLFPCLWRLRTVRFISESCDKYKSFQWLLKWSRLLCWGRRPTPAWNLCWAGVARSELLCDYLLCTTFV